MGWRRRRSPRRNRRRRKRKRSPPPEKTYRLAIFGLPKARYEGQLRLGSHLEARQQGTFSGDGVEAAITLLEAVGGVLDGDWGVETHSLGQDFLALCIGQKGSMRKKIKAATGCFLEYIGTDAFIIGYAGQRAFCKALFETFRGSSKGSLSTPGPGVEEYCESLEIPEWLSAFVS